LSGGEAMINDLRKLGKKKIREMILEYESWMQTAGGRVCDIYCQAVNVRIWKDMVMADLIVSDYSDAAVIKTEKFLRLEYPLKFFEEKIPQNKMKGGKKNEVKAKS
jgi:hypothetical protein